MSSDDTSHLAPLEVDPARIAVPTIRGYVYQTARTALAWANLEPDELLYVEGAEDFDVLGRYTESNQVKDYRRNITLRSDAVMEVIGTSWITRAANSTRDVRYRLLTTAAASSELGNPFGMPGIDYWNELARANYSADRAPAVRKIADFLLANLRLPDAMAQFLRDSNAEEVHARVISILTFDGGFTNGHIEELGDGVRDKGAVGQT